MYLNWNLIIKLLSNDKFYVQFLILFSEYTIFTFPKLEITFK